MTLKALERKKKLEELGLPDPKESKDEASKVPRKRGRPKGQTSKKNKISKSISMKWSHRNLKLPRRRKSLSERGRILER